MRCAGIADWKRGVAVTAAGALAWTCVAFAATTAAAQSQGYKTGYGVQQSYRVESPQGGGLSISTVTIGTAAIAAAVIGAAVAVSSDGGDDDDTPGSANDAIGSTSTN